MYYTYMLPHVVPLTNVVGVLPNGARNCWLRFSRTERESAQSRSIALPRALLCVLLCSRWRKGTPSSSGLAFIRPSLCLSVWQAGQGRQALVLHVPYIHMYCSTYLAICTQPGFLVGVQAGRGGVAGWLASLLALPSPHWGTGDIIPHYRCHYHDHC